MKMVGWRYLAKRSFGLVALPWCICQTAPPLKELVSVATHPTSGTTCRIVTSGTVKPLEVVEGHVELQCPNAGAIVSCDALGYEPTDVPVNEACQRGELRLREATKAAVDPRDWDPGTTVQWLSASSGSALRVVAARRFDEAPSFLAVVEGAEDFVRVTRPGDSPTTLSILGGLGMPELRLPPRLPGAELFIRQEAAVVNGSVARVMMSDGRTEWYPIGQRSSIRGLPPSQSVLEVQFDGGLRAATLPVTLVESRSSDVLVPSKEVGAIKVTASTTVCSQGTVVKIFKLQALELQSGSAHSAAAIPVASNLENCRARVAGLEPGGYRIELLNQDGRLAMDETNVSPQVEREVLLGQESTQLSGRVLLNGKPLASVSMEFRHVDSKLTQDPIVVSADSAGFYHTTLDKPGSYVVTFQSGLFPLFGQEKKMTALPGPVREDFEFSGAAVEVSVEGWDRTSDVLLTLRRNVSLDAAGAGRMTVERQAVLHPADPSVLTIPGLNTGTYVGVARQLQEGIGSKASDLVSFEVERPTDVRKISLSLVSDSSVLRVADALGRPIQGATVVASEGRLRESSPGVFALDTVPNGSELRVQAAGFTPVCRVRRRGQTIDLTLSAGRPGAIQFSTEMSGFPAAKLWYIDSDCPVYLWDIPFSVQTPEANASGQKFLFRNLPLAGTLELFSDDGGTRTPLAESGTTFLKVKR